MKKTETITTLKCDLCGKVVKEFASVSESHGTAIVRLEKKVWYGGRYWWDVCQECSDKILKFLGETFPNMSFGNKRE